MLELFTRIADWLIFSVAGLSPASKLGDALHFFVEDTSKILVLLVVMIYLIAWLRASLKVERVRDYLSGRHRSVGYLLGALFGSVTPFCSCSSIPLFLGFTSARIPVGVTLAFLITSPLINEVAVVLLGSLLGWQFTLLYVAVGLGVGMLGGAVLDALNAERWLQPFVANAYAGGHAPAPAAPAARLTLGDRHRFAKAETQSILNRVWPWVLVGVGLGAALHGYLPEGWISTTLGQGQWWTVPLAVVTAIPLYTNATGVIPVMESLLLKGLPLGTTLAFCMSAVAASFPEFIMLKQVMTWRLLAMLFGVLLAAFTLVGWVFNALSPLFFPIT